MTRHPSAGRRGFGAWLREPRILLRLVVALSMAAPAAPVAAQTAAIAPTSSRDAALLRLANQLDLPLVEETVSTFSTQLRRTVPGLILDSVGQQAGLGPGWRRGDPTYDEAARTLENGLVAEEARRGPLVTLDRGDLLSVVNVPWTEDDIRFLEQTRTTPLGHEAERAIDAKATEQLIHTLQRRVPVVEGRSIRASFADLETRAATQYGDALLTLLPLRATDPLRAARLQRLADAVTVAPSDALGQRVVDRVTQRIVDAAAAQIPELIGIAARAANASH